MIYQHSNIDIDLQGKTKYSYHTYYNKLKNKSWIYLDPKIQKEGDEKVGHVIKSGDIVRFGKLIIMIKETSIENENKDPKISKFQSGLTSN